MNIEKIKEFANTIKRCGDYGELYVNHKTNEVWWCGADSDFNEEDVEKGIISSWDYIEKGFEAIESVSKVYIEAESGPTDDDGDDDPDWQYLGEFGSSKEYEDEYF